MASTPLELNKPYKRTEKGNLNWYYGGGEVAWNSLAEAYAGIPVEVRNGMVFGVIDGNGLIKEYMWNRASGFTNNGQEVERGILVPSLQNVLGAGNTAVFNQGTIMASFVVANSGEAFRVSSESNGEIFLNLQDDGNIDLKFYKNRIEAYDDSIQATAKIYLSGYGLFWRGKSDVFTNLAYGNSALFSNTTGETNLAVGHGAMTKNETGSANVAIGAYAMFENVLSSYNVAIGSNTLQNNTQGTQNLAIGSYALWQNTFGNRNVAIGTSSMLNSTLSSSNTAIGNNTMRNNTTGSNNIAIGQNAGSNLSTGAGNVLIGADSTADNQGVSSGSNNTIIGKTVTGVTTGSGNTLIGRISSQTSKLVNNVMLADGLGNIVFRKNGNGNVMIGSGISANAFVQIQNPTSVSSGLSRTLFQVSTFSSPNTFFVFEDDLGKLHVNNRGGNNVSSCSAYGEYALINQTTGANNTAIGTHALPSLTTGSINTVVGNQAFRLITNANYNTGIGYGIGYSMTSGDFNVFVGSHAGFNATIASRNTLIGQSSANNMTTGIQNTVLGRMAGSSLTTGSRNTIISMGLTGSEGSLGLTIGNNNTIIGGLLVGLQPDLTNNIIIANGVGQIGFRFDGVSGRTYLQGLQTHSSYNDYYADFPIMCIDESDDSVTQFNLSDLRRNVIRYDIYRGILNQSGTNDPTSIDLTNFEFRSAFTWKRIGVGRFEGEISSGSLPSKMLVLHGSQIEGLYDTKVYRISNTKILIENFDITNNYNYVDDIDTFSIELLIPF